MPHDPLHTPLKPRGWRERLRLRASPALVAFAIVLVAAASLIAWAWMQPAPPPRPALAERELPPRPAAPSPAGLAEQPPAAMPAQPQMPAQPDMPEKPPAAAPQQRHKGGSRILDVSQLPDENGAAPPPRGNTVTVDIAGQIKPLPPAPARDLVENSRYGPLPKIGRKGRRPWRVYARPVPAEVLASPRPKVAVIVADLGLKAALTSQAMRTLPPQVSLAFAPRGNKVRALGRKARRLGHEFFLQVPMEPWGYPAVNPGPDTLLASASAKANRQRLLRLLGRAVGYAGIVTFAGQKLLQQGEALAPILHELKARGLLAVDDGTSARSMLPDLALVVKLPALRADVRIPPGLKQEEAKALLEQALRVARERGKVLAVISATPTNIEILRQWLNDLSLDGSVTLLPATALARLDH